MALALGAALGATGAATLPAVASANSSQLAIIQDNLDLSDASSAFGQFRALGANTVRVIVPWALIAPDYSAKRKPKFDATNPSAYPAKNWAPYDNIVNAAKADGLTVDMTVTGGSPVWADGKGIPPQGKNPAFAWKPNAKYYGEFVTAVARRYPSVHFWALFNEPNFGQDLGPEAINGSRISYAPMLYRSLVNAGYKALQSTGHGHDTILIGEFAARGSNLTRPRPGAPRACPATTARPSRCSSSAPCTAWTASYHQLRGTAAGRWAARRPRRRVAPLPRLEPRRCSRPAVSRPSLSHTQSPADDGLGDPDFAAFPDCGKLRRATRPGRRGSTASHTHFPIYNTEYGYITSPPRTPPLRLAGDGRGLHQLGRVPELQERARSSPTCSTC